MKDFSLGVKQQSLTLLILVELLTVAVLKKNWEFKRIYWEWTLWIQFSWIALKCKLLSFQMDLDLIRGKLEQS
jgi:hypothetical protein